jgi:signal transduction histidine kinase
VNPSRFRRTTVFRLALRYAGLYVLITLVVLAFVYRVTRLQIYAQIDNGLRAELEGLETLYKAKGIDIVRGTLALHNLTSKEMDGPEGPGPRYYLLADDNYHILAGNLPQWPKEIHNRRTERITFLPPVPDDATLDTSPAWKYRVRAFTTTLAHGRYHLLVGQSLWHVDQAGEQILAVMLGAAVLTLGMGLGGGILMGRDVLRRIDAVTDTAGEIMSGDLSRRIPLGARDDEFADLARQLNAMLERIDELMQAMRQVTNNVAHDLRRPLNRLRSGLDLALIQGGDTGDYRAAIERAISESDDLIKTFNTLLSIAQAESGVMRENIQEVDLAELCEDVVDLYAVLAEEKNITLISQTEPDLKVQGNAQLLAQAIGNLLDNAIKYTPAGGRIEFNVGRESQGVILRLSDSGPGIPPDQYAQVLKPFVRLEVSRTEVGNGLGLSLVNAVARLHGLRLVLSDNQPGLTVLLHFPHTLNT